MIYHEEDLLRLTSLGYKLQAGYRIDKVIVNVLRQMAERIKKLEEKEKKDE